MKEDKTITDGLRPEYGIATMKSGILRKYVQRYRAGTNLVKIDTDVAAVFCDDNAVNAALRELIKVARHQVALIH